MFNSSAGGASAVETVSTILRLHPEIAELTVFEPASVPLAQERLALDSESQKIIKAGLEIRERVGLPFWDAVLASTLGKGKTGRPILEKALFHNSSIGRRLKIRSRDWTAPYLDSVIQDVIPGQVLVLSSLVQLNGGELGHIPLIDFHCPVSKENREISAHASSLLDPLGGYLLESGQSYHFYGRSVIPSRDFYRFLGRALLLSPVVDRAWVAHQLIEGACGLRISAKIAGGQPPLVVAEVSGLP